MLNIIIYSNWLINNKHQHTQRRQRHTGRLNLILTIDKFDKSLHIRTNWPEVTRVLIFIVNLNIWIRGKYFARSNPYLNGASVDFMSVRFDLVSPSHWPLIIGHAIGQSFLLSKFENRKTTHVQLGNYRVLSIRVACDVRWIIFNQLLVHSKLLLPTLRKYNH